MEIKTKFCPGQTVYAINDRYERQNGSIIHIFRPEKRKIDIVAIRVTQYGQESDEYMTTDGLEYYEKELYETIEEAQKQCDKENKIHNEN